MIANYILSKCVDSQNSTYGLKNILGETFKKYKKISKIEFK